MDAILFELASLALLCASVAVALVVYGFLSGAWKWPIAEIVAGLR